MNALFIINKNFNAFTIITVYGRLTPAVATKYIFYIVLVYFMYGASSLVRKLIV